MTKVISVLASSLPIAVVILVFVIALVVYQVMKGRRRALVFVINVVDGKALVAKGQVEKEVCDDIERVCKLWQVESGTIRAYRGVDGVNPCNVMVTSRRYRKHCRMRWIIRCRSQKNWPRALPGFGCEVNSQS